MIQIPDQRQMDLLLTPVVVFQKSEFIQKLLGRMLVLAIPRVDESWFSPELVALGISSGLILQPAADPFQLAAHDEYRVLVASEGVERISVALSLVERRTIAMQVAYFRPVELRRIAEGFLGPGAVFEEHFIDAEIGIVDPEFLKHPLVLRYHRVLQAPRLVEQIPTLLDTEVVDNRQRSSSEHIAHGLGPSPGKKKRR